MFQENAPSDLTSFHFFYFVIHMDNWCSKWFPIFIHLFCLAPHVFFFFFFQPSFHFALAFIATLFLQAVSSSLPNLFLNSYSASTAFYLSVYHDVDRLLNCPTLSSSPSAKSLLIETEGIQKDTFSMANIVVCI